MSKADERKARSIARRLDAAGDALGELGEFVEEHANGRDVRGTVERLERFRRDFREMADLIMDATWWRK